MMLGRLLRAIAMSTPGMFLSQPGSDTLASYHCARDRAVSAASGAVQVPAARAGARLAAHDGLDTVGDEVARLQAVAHALGAHRHAVADADGVEPVADHARLHHAALHLGRQVQ